MWLFFHKGFAVSTFALRGVCLVGANGDGFQGAVVFIIAVVSAAIDGAADTMVYITAHFFIPPWDRIQTAVPSET